MLCLFLIETSFALSRLDRCSPSLTFDLPLSIGNFHSLFLYNLPQSFLTYPQSMVSFFEPPLNCWTFVLSLSFIHWFYYCLQNISYLPPVWGVILVRVSFEKKYSIRLKWGLQGIYIFWKWKDEQRWHFLISSKVSWNR